MTLLESQSGDSGRTVALCVMNAERVPSAIAGGFGMSPSASREIDATLARVGCKIHNERADRYFFTVVLCAALSIAAITSALAHLA